MVSGTKTVIGEFPAVSFETLRNWFLKDPTVRYHCEYLRDAIAGPGFYIKCKNKNAKKDLEDFCENTNLDGIHQEAILEMIWGGSSFSWKNTYDALKSLHIVPITTIRQIFRDPATADALAYVQQIGGDWRYLDPRGVIHWKWGMDTVEPFGIGLIRPLVETRQFTLKYKDGKSETITVPPFLQMKAFIENDLPYAVHRWAKFKVLYGPEKDAKLDPDWIRTKGSDLLGLEDVVTESRVVAQPIPLEVARGFEPLLDYIENRFFEGCQNPVGRLFTSPGFTEASSRVALLLADRKVNALQRQVKRMTEREIFWPVAEQLGYNPKEIEARLVWKPKDKLDVTLKDLLAALYPLQPANKEQGTYAAAITVQELRDNLQKLSGVELENIEGEEVKKENV